MADTLLPELSHLSGLRPSSRLNGSFPPFGSGWAVEALVAGHCDTVDRFGIVHYPERG